MIRFLKKTIGLFLSFSTLTVVITVVIFSIVNSKADFKISDSNKYVVFGHSHPECAFNDSLISNFKNLSASGESYFYTYQKVKKTLSQNPQIQTIFIEFTTNNFNKLKDDDIWSDEYLNLLYPRYSPFMDVKDHLILMSKNPPSFLNSLSISLNKQVKRIKTDDYRYKGLMGGYLYLDESKTDSLLKIADASIILNKMDDTGISYYNLQYLEKIIKFCYENNKNVYLLRSPYHKKYHGNRFEQKLQKIKESKFSEIEFLDFKDFPIKNSEYANLNHLNYRGAKVFSIWFDNLLKDDLLNQKNKKEVIDEGIKKLDRGM